MYSQSNTSNDLQCCNCGKPGHVYRKCFQPITSIGIICCYLPTGNKFVFPVNKDDTLEQKLLQVPEQVPDRNETISLLANNIFFNMIRRKDSLAFAELVRGKFKLTDDKYITRVLTEVTCDEFKAIQDAKDFDDIWFRLWISKKNSKSRQNEYMRAKKEFASLMEGIQLPSGKEFSLQKLLENTTPRWKDPEWGFPKGRRVPKETDFQCALREFSEETDISFDKISMLPIFPIEETFTGSNGILYRHIYYLACCNEWVEPHINPKNRSQKAEVGDIKWFNSEDVLSHIRDDNPQRRDIFLRLSRFLYRYLHISPMAAKVPPTNGKKKKKKRNV